MSIPQPDAMCTPCFRRHVAAWLLGGTTTACTHPRPAPVSVVKPARSTRWPR